MIKSKAALLPDSLFFETVSAWAVWEVVLTATFVILSLLTLYFILAEQGLFKRKRKKSYIPVKSGGIWSFWSPKSSSKPKKKHRSAERRARNRKDRPGNHTISLAGRPKRRSGVSNPRRKPYIRDDSVIISYTRNHPAVKKKRASWEKVVLDGFDGNGNGLYFSVYLLRKAFMWAPGSADVIEVNKRAVNPGKYFKSKGIKRIFQAAAGLISVGVVTDLPDGEQKEGLARARAETMVAWMKRALTGKKVDYLLILECPLVESGPAIEAVRQPEKQRPVLWIGLREPVGAVNIEAALIEGLSRAMQLPFDIEAYQTVSLFPINPQQG
ncbi:hypothetical protein KKI24_20255 [bacterium]|nr:hypothetical protein [bacterium]